MFSDQGDDCVFMEMCKGLKYMPHMFIECIPMPRETGDLAPMFFKVSVHQAEL